MVQSASIVGNNLIKKRTIDSAASPAADRKAHRRRVKEFYLRFNNTTWDGCHALIDPELTQQSRVNLASYSELMQASKDVYGSVNPCLIRLSLHLEASPSQLDKRPFAYVYVIWQDDVHGFHMFRERWVKGHGQWYTRVDGLIPNRREMDSRRE
jgi:hypothetical protein